MKNKLLLTAAISGVAVITSFILVYKQSKANRFNFNRKLEQKNLQASVISPDLKGHIIVPAVNNHSHYLFLLANGNNTLSCLDTLGKLIYQVPLKVHLTGPYSIVIDNNRVRIVDFTAQKLHLIDPLHQQYDSITLPFVLVKGYALAPGKIVLKSPDANKGTFSLKHYIVGNPEPHFISGQHVYRDDGGIAGDGMFIPANDSMALYIHYFTNSTYLLNAEGRLIYSKASLVKPRQEVKIASRGNSHTLDESAAALNYLACTDRQNLYILSNVAANNEKPGDFKNNNVVDVYDLATGSYASSFYIPAYNGSKIRSLTTLNGSIYCLQGGYLIKYRYHNEN